ALALVNRLGFFDIPVSYITAIFACPHYAFPCVNGALCDERKICEKQSCAFEVISFAVRSWLQWKVRTSSNDDLERNDICNRHYGDCGFAVAGRPAAKFPAAGQGNPHENNTRDDRSLNTGNGAR